MSCNDHVLARLNHCIEFGEQPTKLFCEIGVTFAIAFTICLRKMMGFSIGKTAWRSLLTVALYYIMLGFIALIGIIAFAAIYLHKYNS